MYRRTVLKLSSTVAIPGVVSLAGCADDGDETEENVVVMETEGDEYYFDPIGLFVESGGMVTFRLESGSHTSTAYEDGNGIAEVTRIPEDADAWDSGTLSEQGETFEHTFEVTGTYDYYCIPHKSLEMVGRIVVDEPGGPAEGSMPPDGDVPDSQTIVDQGVVTYNDLRSLNAENNTTEKLLTYSNGWTHL